MNACVYGCTCMCVHLDGKARGQLPASRLVYLVFETGPFTGLELTKQTRTAGNEDAGVHLSLPLHYLSQPPVLALKAYVIILSFL